MINAAHHKPGHDAAPGAGLAQAEVDAIVDAGPRGAFLLAGLATAVVVLLWVAFYLLVFLPRAPGA